MKADGILLSVQNLAVSYGHVKAIHGISFDVGEGEIVTLLGANGAGKSTILRAVSGLLAYQGNITFQGRPLPAGGGHKLVRLGITHVPEGRGIFGNLTVMENLILATWPRRDKARIAGDYERVFQIFPRLAERKEQSAGTLSGGEQQMLAVGRALMSRGRLMLLDEPSMGLAPVRVREIFEVLAEINREGTTILLVEQNAHMALRLAARGYVLENGLITVAGTTDELKGNPKVKAAYLGG